MKTIEARNKQLEHDDRKYIWPPFTQMKEHVRQDPIIIEEGSGCVLKDIYGHEYIDGASSLWTNVHGHRKEKLDTAIKNQLDKLAHSTMLGLSNVPAIRLAKKLVEITPEGLSRVFYSDSGSTAAEIAIKIAFQYQQQAVEGNPKKTKFISIVNAYHGDTIGSVSVGGIDLFHQVYSPLLFKTFKADSPYCYRCRLKKTYPECKLACLDSLKKILEKHSREIAASRFFPFFNDKRITFFIVLHLGERMPDRPGVNRLELLGRVSVERIGCHRLLRIIRTRP